LALFKAYTHQRIFAKLLISFLVVGILPIIFSGFAYRAVSSRLLIQDTGNRIYKSTSLVSFRLDEILDDNSRIIEDIESDNSFAALFDADRGCVLTDKDKADLYNRIYMYLGDKDPKVGVYVMDADGINILSTKVLPEEYNPVKNKNWGIFRKSDSGKSDIIYYSHMLQNKDENARVLSICKTVYIQNIIVGYIIVDLYQEHFFRMMETVSNPERFLFYDENYQLIFSLSEQISRDTVAGFLLDSVSHLNSFTAFTENRQQFLFSRYKSEETGLHVVGIQALNQLLNITKDILFPFVFLVAIASFISFLMAFFVARNISEPLYEVIKCVEKVEQGDFSIQTSIDRKDEFAILGKSVNAMILRIKELISHIKTKERSLRIAEMEALQAQIHPHMIFNTLEMIKWYIRLGQNEKATHILVQFAKLLRQGIDNKDEIVTVRDEIAVIGIYLDIQKHRFEDKLTTDIDIQSDILEYKIPKYIIQPIVENSIVHGLKNKIDPGHIRVRGYEDDGDLIFIISDNGTGIIQSEVDQILAGDTLEDDHKSGTGIRNVMKRIKLYYGSEYGLYIESEVNVETTITLRMHTDPVV